MLIILQQIITKIETINKIKIYFFVNQNAWDRRAQRTPKESPWYGIIEYSEKYSEVQKTKSLLKWTGKFNAGKWSKGTPIGKQ